MNVPQQTHVVVNNVLWYLFSAQYETPDGTYEAHRLRCHFYAISFYHAHMVLSELKSTAKLTGQVVGAYAA